MAQLILQHGRPAVVVGARRIFLAPHISALPIAHPCAGMSSSRRPTPSTSPPVCGLARTAIGPLSAGRSWFSVARAPWAVGVGGACRRADRPMTKHSPRGRQRAARPTGPGRSFQAGAAFCIGSSPPAACRRNGVDRAAWAWADSHEGEPDFPVSAHAAEVSSCGVCVHGRRVMHRLGAWTLGCGR
jgi:hypothetical protein